MDELKRLEILEIYAGLYDIWKLKKGYTNDFISERGKDFYIKKLKLYYNFKKVYEQEKERLKLKGLIK